MKILSTNSGSPVEIEFRGQVKHTSMRRTPQKKGIRLEFSGIQGDLFGDPKFHGTDDNKLYALGMATHRGFERLVAIDERPSYGAFGENLNVEDLDESQIFMGDVFRIGSAEVQATYPRIPCSKLNYRFQNAEALAAFRKLRKPGVYFRVLKAGLIRPGDVIEKIAEESNKVSILALYDWLTAQSDAPNDWLDRVRAVRNPPEYVRKKLESLSPQP